MMYRNTEVQNANFCIRVLKRSFWKMKVNIIFQNIQLLACFFFWTSSTSNLYLAIQSSCRKRKREVKTIMSTNQCNLHGVSVWGLLVGCALC